MPESRYHVVKKFCLALFLSVVLGMTGCAAQSNTLTLADGTEAQRVRGKVETVEADIGVLILEVRGQKAEISFTERVAKRGFVSMTEIRKGNPLEVIYRHDNLGNYAVSIKRLPEGSCDT